jgi:hypothetical protein
MGPHIDFNRIKLEKTRYLKEKKKRERENQERKVRYAHDQMSKAEWFTSKRASRHVNEVEEEEEDSEIL